jgi:hypothetical protein
MRSTGTGPVGLASKFTRVVAGNHAFQRHRAGGDEAVCVASAVAENHAFHRHRAGGASEQVHARGSWKSCVPTTLGQIWGPLPANRPQIIFPNCSDIKSEREHPFRAARISEVVHVGNCHFGRRFIDVA